MGDKKKHTGGHFPSHFSLKQVNVPQQYTEVVDPGCLRCQHCLLLRHLRSAPPAELKAPPAEQGGKYDT